MAEPVLFQEGAFQITRRRVQLQDQQYALQDITSVEIDTARLPRFLTGLGVVFGTGLLMVSQANGSLTWLAAGVSLLAIVGFLWWRARRTYILVLGTTGGPKQVLTSTDRRLIDRAAQAIDGLLVERSRRTV